MKKGTFKLNIGRTHGLLRRNLEITEKRGVISLLAEGEGGSRKRPGAMERTSLPIMGKEKNTGVFKPQ